MAAGLLNVVGAGPGGVNDLSARLDPSTVAFGLCRIPLGTGTFVREKFVLIHFNPGEDCGGAVWGEGGSAGGRSLHRYPHDLAAASPHHGVLTSVLRGISHTHLLMLLCAEWGNETALLELHSFTIAQQAVQEARLPSWADPCMVHFLFT